MAEADSKNVGINAYINNFVSILNALTTKFSLYSNLIGRVKVRDNDVNEISQLMTEDERQEFIQLNNELRYYVSTSYIYYSAIRKSLTIQPKDDIEKIYLNCKNTSVQLVDDVEKFIIELNVFLIENLLNKLLEDNNEQRTKYLG